MRVVIGKTSALNWDTDGDRDREINPAEADGSENNRAEERGQLKVKPKAKAMVGESTLKRPQDLYCGDPEERTSHINVPLWLGSAGLRRGEESLWSRAHGNVGSGLRGCEREIPFSLNRITGDRVIHQVTREPVSRPES